VVTLVSHPGVLGAACIAQVSGRFDRSGRRAARSLVAGRLPGQLQGAVQSRQIEFLAGRWCARRALRAIDPAANHEVGIAADGTPLWPPGFVGSITHTADFVWAAAASRRDAAAIGIDSEPIMTAARAHRLAPSIARPDEIARTRAVLGVDFAAATSLLFSAKESLFKCLSAHLGRAFDCLDARVVVSREPGSFRAMGIEGRLELDATHVHTGVMLAATDVPTRVARAQPVHRSRDAFRQADGRREAEVALGFGYGEVLVPPDQEHRGPGEERTGGYSQR